MHESDPQLHLSPINEYATQSYITSGSRFLKRYKRNSQYKIDPGKHAAILISQSLFEYIRRMVSDASELSIVYCVYVTKQYQIIDWKQ